MVKLCGGTLVMRSMLFVPGHEADLAPKAAASMADCIVLDLQDAVPPHYKAGARAIVRSTLDSGILRGKIALVRINPWASGLSELDIDTVACESLQGFVYPMTGSPADIECLDSALAQKEASLGLAAGCLSIVPTVETTLGLINAYPIAKASERVIALFFGAEDFMNELRGQQDSQQRVLQTPRALIAIAARAAGVEPIDTPYLEVHDLEGLREHAGRARDLGMSGMAVLTPRQIPVVHEVYSPSEKEMQDALQIVEAFEEAACKGHATAMTCGMFVDSPVVQRARKLLARADAIRERQWTSVPNEHTR